MTLSINSLQTLAFSLVGALCRQQPVPFRRDGPGSDRLIEPAHPGPSHNPFSDLRQ